MGQNDVALSNIGSQQLLRPTRLPFAMLKPAVMAELYRFFVPNSSGALTKRLVYPARTQIIWCNRL